jgi:hypothetical protein
MPTRRLLAVALLALAVTGYAAAATATRTATIKARLTWGSATRGCAPARAGSVICISARGASAKLGRYEYARDAVPAGGQTRDGCVEYGTHGTLWVKGGKLAFVGAPATTCGADPRQPGLTPDANYVVTFKSGTGVLKGASGRGTILAASGVDIWNVTLTLRK